MKNSTTSTTSLSLEDRALLELRTRHNELQIALSNPADGPFAVSNAEVRYEQAKRNLKAAIAGARKMP